MNDEDRELIVQQVKKSGGKISYKENPDGSQSPYELNVNYFSALGSVEKMLAAHAILLAFIGVPAIYYHSIFGSKNDLKAVEESKLPRRINREKLDKTKLYHDLEENNDRKKIYEGISKMLIIRKEEEAFDPYGQQELLNYGKEIFALQRADITVLVNLTNKTLFLSVNGFDLISQKDFSGKLEAYQYAWVKNENSSSN